MKKIIFLLVISLLNIAGCALNRNAFPKNLRKTLDQRTAEIKSNEGIFIAGRIKTSDGSHIHSGEDVLVNFYDRVDAPLWVYDGGWFLMDRIFPANYAGPRNKLVLRAFKYEPEDVTIKVKQGKITYMDLVMQKTPDKDLATVTGIVLDDQNEPSEGAFVNLLFPYANHGYRGNTGYTHPHAGMKTGPDGKYSFNGISAAEYSLVASKPGYAYHSIHIVPAAGQTVTQDLKLFRDKGIVIYYVYQADGSRSFVDGQLQSGTLEWVNGNEGVDFEDGRVERGEPNSQRDINIRQEQGVLKFQIYTVSETKNGFYDAGEVNFESIKEADLTSYPTAARPCIVGHTYIVRTYEGNYAKFIVRSISGSE